LILSKILKKNIEKTKEKHKIQDGKITYSDLDKPAKSLFSKKYRISGKPDYIVKHRGNIIPVEMKSGSYDRPQKNHIFQLAAYCHLVEENYGVFVPYGVLVYNNSSFNIKFDPSIRFELENTITKMRNIIKRGKVSGSVDNYRCKNCSMKNYCQ
jgi:CRISPR-associated exonuclease Cas4